jgi:GntR family transcriptional repressor for pyruvate dehydrogenase complex
MKPIKKESVVSQVVESILEYIRSEKLALDSKLPTESELCKQLSVSRSSLREAFRILEAQGFVTIKPGRGAFVSSPLVNDDLEYLNQWFNKHQIQYMDLLEVRFALEMQAVRTAADRMTSEELDALKNNLEEFRSLIYEKDSYKRLAELDQEFHETIINSTRNSYMRELYKRISEEIIIFRYSIMKIGNRRENTYYPHLKIYEAFKSYDPEQSAKAMKEHLQLAEEDMLELASHKI